MRLSPETQQHIKRLRVEVVATCMPSSSGGAWWSGPRATCPARVPGADLLVVKPSGVDYAC